LHRRSLLQAAATLATGIALTGCDDNVPPHRFTADDQASLARQRAQEQANRGNGPYGVQRYQGYRGLAALPWFDLNDAGELQLIDDSVPRAIDVHAHLGISVLFKPELDLLAQTPRVKHLLDCDATTPGCDLDLDIYINGNFDDAELKTLGHNTLTQGLWGNERLRTHTIPNLLREMNAMGVTQSVVLPIKLDLPFGDSLTEDWRNAIAAAGAGNRLIAGLSVYPGDENAIDELRAHAATGARMVKLHPTVQQFFPDDPKVFPIYEEARDLGLVIFFHGGRAGIEPGDRQQYALPRHYSAVLRNFPELPVVMGHAGARDGEAMLELMAHDNCWLGIHGQGVTALHRIIERTGGRRLLFGTDWPWYHIGATLAKVLLCTESQPELRRAMLRDNALQLLPELA
jgi:predicted TIM-barrel fold metal-dependent hydrolase